MWNALIQISKHLQLHGKLILMFASIYKGIKINERSTGTEKILLTRTSNSVVPKETQFHQNI
jgi:hypothetical protein